MAAAFDLVIHRARLRRDPSVLVDIGITAGRVTAAGQISGDVRIALDAAGNLVTAAFVNPHLHLDKVYTLEMLDEQAETLYDMITTDAAKAVGAAVAEPAPEAPADLVVLDAPSVPEALRSHEAPRHVIRGGRVVTSPGA